MDIITDIMSSEFHWAKLVLGVAVGVVVNVFFAACYFRKKKKTKQKEEANQEIEIIPPLEDDTLGVIDKYEKLHTETSYSYTTGNKPDFYTTDTTNLDLLEQQLFENVQGTNVVRTEQYSERKAGNKVSHEGNEKQSGVQNSLANAIRQQVHRCHTAIVHLQNRLQNETSKRQQAEEWCSMLEKELTAHLGARQAAETKCEKLNQRIRLLTRKLKSQERILRKRQKEAWQNSLGTGGNKQEEIYQQIVPHAASNGLVHNGELIDGPASGDQNLQEGDNQEDICDEYTNSYTSFVEDDEPHFASDLDEDKIAEPQELQQIIEAVNEASDDEDDLHKMDSEGETDEEIDFESDEEEPRSGEGVDDGGGFEIENDVMHQLVANAVCGDLSDLLSGDAEVSDEDSLSDLVAANMAEDDENEFVIDSSVLQEVNEGSVDSSVLQEVNEADISSESIGNTKSTREFWEKKATEQEELPKETQEFVFNEPLEKIEGSTKIRRGGSFRDPPTTTRIPILKPSGKEYSREAESVHTRSMNPEIIVQGPDTSEEGRKLSIEAMREHWEKNQRRWGSSHVINTGDDDTDSGNQGDCRADGGLDHLERSTDFKDLKEQWKKKNDEKLGRPEVVDINENTKIDRDRSPGFQALKDEWESKTHDPDDSL